MGLDTSIAGRTGATTRYGWTITDSMLYALGVGAGQDPLRELDLAAETGPHGQRALPTRAIVTGMNGTDRPSLGDVDRTKFVHRVSRSHREP